MITSGATSRGAMRESTASAGTVNVIVSGACSRYAENCGTSMASVVSSTRRTERTLSPCATTAQPRSCATSGRSPASNSAVGPKVGCPMRNAHVSSRRRSSRERILTSATS